jgi:template-activating factor I
VLKKEYKFVPPPAASEETPDADGITPSMLDFSWERDVEPQATKIDWKDESKNLTKLYPIVLDEDDPDSLSEPGSFFNFFETAKDYNNVSFFFSPDFISMVRLM